MPLDPLINAIVNVLGLPPDAAARLRVTPFTEGGNNRVFEICIDGQRYVAKVYFRHPTDRRDRLHSEYSFLQYAQRVGIRCVPQPIALDIRYGLGIYEYLGGKKLGVDEISEDHINQAANFVLQLNHSRERGLAHDLPTASEACFSLGEHFAMVDHRLACLAGVQGVDVVDREAANFIHDLLAHWEVLKNRIVQDTNSQEFDLVTAFVEPCISPSDFGFHNALVTNDRGLCFLDFEYAGWDDPAKMVGDFFSHPAASVSPVYFEKFLRAVADCFTRPELFIFRARRLLPIFQIKWCCIILNEFLPDAVRRRSFANPKDNVLERKNTQLNKAKYFFERIA